MPSPERVVRVVNGPARRTRRVPGGFDGMTDVAPAGAGTALASTLPSEGPPMSRHALAATAVSALLLCAACASTPAPPAAAPVDLDALTAQVRARETAFAQTMADRDHAAF